MLNPKSVLKQANVQHLYASLEGTLQTGRSDAEVLELLSPTPAICGRPRGQAAAAIEEVEGWDRGRYSGPFGWVAGTLGQDALF